MNKLFKYFDGFVKETICAPLFKLLEAGLELIVPIIVAAIIDKGIATLDKAYVVKMTILLICFGLIGLGFSVCGQFFSAKTAVGVSSKLRSDLFKTMQGLSFSEIDTLGSSSMITRMTSDVNQVQSGINLTLRLFLRSPFIVFGAAIMAFTIDVKSALIFVVAIPVISIVVFSIMSVSIKLYKQVQQKLDNVMGSTRENLTGARVIRAFGIESDEIEEYNKYTKALNKAQNTAGNITSLMNPLTYIIINIAIIVLIKVGAIRVNDGIISQGQVIALYNYMSQILVELIKLANLIINVTKAVASAKRIQEILEMKSSIEHVENKNIASSYIEFKNVSMKYQGAGENSLSNISFKVNKGDTIGIIGGTGSGKSTLVNLIPHFYDTTEGELLIDGKNVKAYDDEALRDKIGIVLQKAVLFKGTIRENLCWGKNDASDEELLEAIDIAQAKDVIKNKDKGLDAFIEQNGKNLSGGQRQRLAIARAVVKKPDILILDDSASALDYATDAKLRHALNNLSYKPTIFIVSQRTASIQNANNIVVLDDGKVVGFGTHDELLKNCVEYQEIHYSQFKKEV